MRKNVLLLFLLISTLHISGQHALQPNGPTSKMSSYVRTLVMQQRTQHPTPNTQHPSPNTQHPSPNTHRLTALVQTTDADMLKEEGCQVLASWGDIHVASIPITKIQHLVSLPQIKRIEAGQPCQITNDSCAHVTRVSSRPDATLHNDVRSKHGLTGNGVVVGLMDIGFDMKHPTFREADGQTMRIQALWDQLDLSGEGGTLPVGREYVGLDALWDKACSADISVATHGTHTAGTAAGSGYEGRYSGMAPGSDICLVSNMTGTNRDLVPEEMWSQYTTATDILGFKYIFDYAESVGKPCVINFSEGSHDDFYESLLYCEALNRMTGPGRILCASAGNEGGKGTYMHKSPYEGKVGAFLYSSSKAGLYTMSSTAPVQLSLSFYPNDAERIDWHYDTTPLSAFPDSIMADTLQLGSKTCAVMVAVYPSCYNEDEYATELYIENLQDITFGSSPLRVSLELTQDNTDINVYSCGGYFMACELNPSLTDFTSSHNILFPGSAEDVICVGSTSYVENITTITGRVMNSGESRDGALASFSSTGPTLNNLCKPDVVAPGVYVTSSQSSYWLTDPPQFWNIAISEFEGRKYPWTIDSGTSMSTPVVAGIIALWLELCPTLSPEDVKDVLAHSCTHPDPSLDYPNCLYGYGQVDALAGADYIMTQYLGIDKIYESTSQQDNGSTSQRVTDLQGRPVNDGYRGIVIERTEHGYRKTLRQ